MYTSRDPRAHHEVYFALVRQIVQAAPSTWGYVENINNQILTGNLYKALKEAKKLIAYEEEIAGQCKARRKPTKTWQDKPQIRVSSKRRFCSRPRRGCNRCTTPGTSNSSQLDEALLYNRKLWSVFLSEMTDANNPMPKDVRQNVANIGLFVMNHTVTVMTDPRPQHLGSLININREIAAGLLGRA